MSRKSAARIKAAARMFQAAAFCVLWLKAAIGQGLDLADDWHNMHIKNTIFALLLPNLLLSANNVLMIRSYFITSIPDALFDVFSS